MLMMKIYTRGYQLNKLPAGGWKRCGSITLPAPPCRPIILADWLNAGRCCFGFVYGKVPYLDVCIGSPENRDVTVHRRREILWARYGLRTRFEPCLLSGPVWVEVLPFSRGLSGIKGASCWRDEQSVTVKKQSMLPCRVQTKLKGSLILVTLWL